MPDDIEEHWESHIAEFLPQCPLCSSKSLDFDVEYGSVRDHIYCPDCKAKWEIDWKGEDFKIEYMILLEVVNTEKYGSLVNVKHNLEFWLEMISNTQEGNAAAKEAAEKTAVSKVRCRYCRTLFADSLDVCPYCGGKR